MKHQLTALVLSSAFAFSSLIQGTSAATITGSAAAAAKDNFTVEDMLTYAIQDEVTAKATYQSIIDAFGSQRPFTNIIKAEDNHTNQLKTLLDTYDIDMPVTTAVSAPVFASVEDAKAAGVTAEINNIAMYESFLEQELPADVEFVFANLIKASQNHLAAFSRTSNTATWNRQGNGGVQARQNINAPTSPLHSNVSAGTQGRRFGQQ